MLDGEVKYLRNLRGIFKTKSKSEILSLNFSEDLLIFNGDLNSYKYEIKTSNLNHYGNYLCNEIEKPNNFAISISLKHILSLLKIAEMIDGNVSPILDSNDIVNGRYGSPKHRNLRYLPVYPFPREERFQVLCRYRQCEIPDL